MQFTAPDLIPWPTGADTIGNKTGDWLAKTLEEQAKQTQKALTERDGVNFRRRGSAEGNNLDTMFVPSQHFGTWDITSFGGATPLPSEFVSRGVLEITGATQFNVTQRITARDQNTTWHRTALDTSASTPVWSAWKTVAGAQGSANGRDLNFMFDWLDFGVHDVNAGGATSNLPAGFRGRGTLEITANSKYTVVQRLTSREQSVTWQRTGQDVSSVNPTWSAWAIVTGPAFPDATQVVIGDSLALLLGENVGSTMPDAAVAIRGWSGDTTDGITTRIGAKRTIWAVQGGSIPASGNVPVTTTMKLALPQFNTVYTGHLNGVAGKLYWTSDDGFYFTRDAPGTAVASPGKSVFEPRWTMQTQFMTFLITMSRNDLSLNSQGVDVSVEEHIKGNYLELTNWIEAGQKRMGVLGTLNRTNEPIGHQNHTRVLELERWWKDTYPGSFIPWRRYIIDQAIYDLGITPTPADLTNMANDCPPPSVMADITHPTPAAAQMTWQKLIRPWQLGKGWV